MRRKYSLAEKYPPSQPCSCKICLSYCARPGWWTPDEAARAIEAGYGKRMMLEMSPYRCFGVHSPAFKGCEVLYADIEKSWNTPAGHALVMRWGKLTGLPERVSLLGIAR